MSDPAVEAAERAERESGWWKSSYAAPWDRDYAIWSAREALAPIRELHQAGEPFEDDNEYVRGIWVTNCRECRDDWPCATARLVYSSDELGGE